jgi:flavin reductase (DIM6/NTAB) family NADH-FMN oxidoreductase RutF
VSGWSRRRFLEGGSGAAAIAAIWGCAPDGPPEMDGSAPSPDEGPVNAPAPLTGPRRRLSEPGPMIPPCPAILLTVNGRPGDPDEISVLWTFVVNGDPPQIGVSAGFEHQARELLELHDEFVLNVPVVSMMEAFDTCDMNSSRVGDKFELSGLTRGQASVVAAPTVEESPIHCECRVIGSLEVPPVRKIFVAEVVATTAAPGAVDDGGRLIVPAVDFFGMTAGSGEHYTMGRRVGNIGMTVGRTDIKY